MATELKYANRAAFKKSNFNLPIYSLRVNEKVNERNLHKKLFHPAGWKLEAGNEGNDNSTKPNICKNVEQLQCEEFLFRDLIRGFLHCHRLPWG